MSSLFIYSFSLNFQKFPKFVKRLKPIKNKNIILISPHPDDIAVGCGGAVSLLSSYNKITPLLFFTGFRGVKGKNKLKSIQVREKEMKKEARILKINKPLFLHLKSYNKESRKNLKQDILKVKKALEKYRPNIIFLPQENDLQPRHHLSTQITLKALRQMTNLTNLKLFFYETVWGLFSAFDFNTAFILSSRVMRKKLEAIKVHKSQLQRTIFDQAAKNLARFRALIIPEQRINGYGGSLKSIGQYIEVFKIEKL